MTALLLAFQHQNTKVALCLLENGVDLYHNEKGGDQRSPLMVACENDMSGCIDMTDMDVNLKNPKGFTALLWGV